MTYDQIEKMSKDDLVYAFKRMTEIAEELDQTCKEVEQKFNDRDADFGPYAHIGMLEARMVSVKYKLESVIEVLTDK